MSTPLRIDSGLPPLLWSTVQKAFDDINQNFTTVYASIEGGGITPVDFGSLSTNVSPSENSIYDLGSSLKKWRDLHINGNLNIGAATITSVGSAVNLPSGSTIGGSLLDQEYFRNIEVSGQPTLIADAGGNATLTINPGTGVSITTNDTTDTINFTNIGIISASAGTGISVSGTNPLQITNTGIISASAGTGISVSGTNPLEITNTGVTRIEAGNGMILDTNTGTVTITNGSPASTLRCFEYINLGTGGIVRADNNFDTLNITGDEHILINKTGSAASNNIEFTFNNHVDIIGSIFAEDSSVMIDATSGTVVGPVSTSSLRTSETKIALGSSAGSTSQGADAVAIGFAAAGTNQGDVAVSIGRQAGSVNQGVGGVAVGYGAGGANQGAAAISIGSIAGGVLQGTNAIAVGNNAGATSQGTAAIAIGYLAGYNTQSANSIVLNASGVQLDGAAAGLYVSPIRNIDGGAFLNYNASTKEIGYSNDIRSETSFNIDINLSDSTLRRWTFGEDGDLTLPTGFIKPSTTDKGLIIEGPNYADWVELEGGGYDTISNGVNIVTHRGITNEERMWSFANDGALYPPFQADNYQIGAIEWRQSAPYEIVNQIRTTVGNGVDQFPGLKLFSYANPVANDHAITLQAGFNHNWIFKNDGSLTLPGDIKSEGNINIDINLSDSTLRRWTFGEDGELSFPNGTVQTTAWAGIPGPYADDTAAAAAGVAVGYPYQKTGTGGQVFVRLT